MRTLLLALLAGTTLITSCGTPSNEEIPSTGVSSFGVIATAVYGVVRHPDGQPARDVLVTASSAEDPAVAVPELAVVSNEVGAYEWPLRPGRYRLSVVSHTGLVTLVEVAVVEGQRVRADFDLRE